MLTTVVGSIHWNVKHYILHLTASTLMIMKLLKHPYETRNAVYSLIMQLLAQIKVTGHWASIHHDHSHQKSSGTCVVWAYSVLIVSQ